MDYYQCVYVIKRLNKKSHCFDAYGKAATVYKDVPTQYLLWFEFIHFKGSLKLLKIVF